MDESIKVPRELSDRVAATVGIEQRDQFVIEAIEARLAGYPPPDMERFERERRERQTRALAATVGSLKDAGDYLPEWETAESIRQWVHELRYGKGSDYERFGVADVANAPRE